MASRSFSVAWGRTVLLGLYIVKLKRFVQLDELEAHPRRVNMEDIRPHDLRRTAAAYLVNRGKAWPGVERRLESFEPAERGHYTQSRMEPSVTRCRSTQNSL